MNKRFISVPFKMVEAKSGFSSLDGMAKISPAGIVLEYEEKFIGLIKQGIKEVRVPIEEIERIKFKKGWVQTKIEIWLNNFQTLSQIPNKDGRIILELAKEDRDTAQKGVDVLEKSAAEYKKEIPPPRTSVKSLFDDIETSELNEK